MAKGKIPPDINEEVANKLIQGLSVAIFEIKEGIDGLGLNKENFNIQLEKVKEDLINLQKEVGKLSLKRIFMDIQKLEETIADLRNEVFRLREAQAVTNQKLEQMKEYISKSETVVEIHKKAVHQQEVINGVTKDNVSEEKEKNKQQEGKITTIIVEMAKWAGVALGILFLAEKMSILK